MSTFTCPWCGASIDRQALECAACDRSVVPNEWWKHKSVWITPLLRLPRAPDAEACDYARTAMRVEGWIFIFLFGFLTLLMGYGLFVSNSLLHACEARLPALEARVSETGVPSDVGELLMLHARGVTEVFRALRILSAGFGFMSICVVFLEARTLIMTERLLALIPPREQGREEVGGSGTGTEPPQPRNTTTKGSDPAVLSPPGTSVGERG